MAEKEKDLYYLRDISDYKVASNDTDIRGWKIKDADGRTVGKVDDLLVHKRSERVVYVDVEVDRELIDVGHDPFQNSAQQGVREFINKDGENHLIVPIGFIDIDQENKIVRTDAIDHKTFRNTKRFSKGSDLDRNYELTVYNSYVPKNDLRDDNSSGDTFYDRSEFNRRNS